MMRTLLYILTTCLPEPRVIYDREGGTAYLSRWYLVGDRPKDDELAGQAKDADPDLRNGVSVFLHRFHRSDDDGALHSHPWKWCVSLILAGGYHEERRDGDRVILRTVLPGTINVIRNDDYHRVDLIEHDAWSLFIAGPKVGTWFFWDRATKMRAPWRGFINAKRGFAPDAGWQPDSREWSGDPDRDDE